MAKSNSRFSKQTIDFIKKASRQKNPDWLDRNRTDFETLVRQPLQALAGRLALKLKPLAPNYHFPQKGIGRLKRSVIRAKEQGSFYKSYVSFTAARPSLSRFDSNPSIFFMINTEDNEGDEVILAGGLYMPSSRQLRSIRERISENPAPFENLFKSKTFKASFTNGFSDERSATRSPRGFDPSHSHIHWLKLQGFFVWRSYTKKQYTSANFPDLVAKDGMQILRLNELLDLAISNQWPKIERAGDEKMDLPIHDF